MTAVVQSINSTPGAGRAFRKNVETVAPRCMHCGVVARLTTGGEVYPHRPDLTHKRFWVCDTPRCGSHVGCHPHRDSARGGMGDGTVPLGRPANHHLRKLRTAAHAAFDPTFRDSDGRVTRRYAYEWLRRKLKLDFGQEIAADECHMGNFDEEACRAVLHVMETYGHELLARRRA